MLRAIAAAKKKNDRIDANKICDCLRCDFLPGLHMARRRFVNGGARCAIVTCWVRQMVQMKNQDQLAADGSRGEL